MLLNKNLVPLYQAKRKTLKRYKIMSYRGDINDTELVQGLRADISSRYEFVGAYGTASRDAIAVRAKKGSKFVYHIEFYISGERKNENIKFRLICTDDIATSKTIEHKHGSNKSRDYKRFFNLTK